MLHEPECKTPLQAQGCFAFVGGLTITYTVDMVHAQHMSISKQLKDQLIRHLAGQDTVPRGLNELNHYFRVYGPIKFQHERRADGSYIARSDGFRFGSIVTSGQTLEDLDEQIKDAILTSFEVPSSYAKEAQLHRVGDQTKEYAFA